MLSSVVFQVVEHQSGLKPCRRLQIDPRRVLIVRGYQWGRLFHAFSVKVGRCRGRTSSTTEPLNWMLDSPAVI